MVDDLFDISRIRLGKVELKKQRLDFRTVLNSALEATRTLIEAGGHELAVMLSAQPFPLDADHTRLTQVFANLISNSARYTPSSGRIQVRAGAQDETLVVTVSDTGIGIPKEMLTRVFDLFAQADEPTVQSQGGLGIGLALVRRLVQMHNGSISAESPGAGGGCTFTVRLPLASMPAASDSSSSGQSTPAAKRRRILVVDDNADAAETLKLLLELEGHDTRCAYTGESALTVAAEFVPDTVLLDIGLPGLSGYEVARKLRQETRLPESLLLVALTGWGSEEDRQQARAAGFDRHLVKPVELDKLREALR
jgi:CheY-like chemotaxis protein/two-component sensor histidine kinase